MLLKSLKNTVWIIFAAFAINAQAENKITLGPLTLHHIHATPAPIVGGTGAVFVDKIDNQAENPVKIIAAQSNIAQRVELHTMKMENNVMKMREVPEIVIPVGENHALLAPGGEYHFMLMNLNQPLNIGEHIELEIKIADQPPVKITVPVEKRAPSDQHGEHQHHHHH